MILREIAIKLGLDVDAQSFMKGELAAKALEHGLEKLVEWGKEAVEGFIEIVKGTAETGRELDKTAQMTGLTTKALQELRFAADESGTGADNLSTGVFHLARSMAAAKKGGDEQGAAFKKLGVHVSDAHGKLRNADEVLTNIAGGFAKMPDGIDKTALAIEIFGRSGAAMIPMLNKGKEGLEELRKEAYVMTPEQIAAGKELTLTLEAITRTTKNLWKAAISPLLPAITTLAKRFLAWKRANAEVIKQQIQKYIGYLIYVVTKLVDVFNGALEVFGVVKDILLFLGKTVIGVVVYALDLLGVSAKTAALVFVAAWVAASAPLLAIGAIIGGMLLLLNSFRRYREGKDSIVGDWLKMLDDWMKPRDTDTWFIAALKTFIKLIEDAAKRVEKFYNELKNAPDPKSAGKTVVKGAAGAANFIDDALYGWMKPDFIKHFEQRTDAASAQGAGFIDAARAGFNSGPYAPSASGTSGARVIVNAPVGINITQQPGQSSEELANIIDQRIQSHQDTVHEDAAAALGD